MQRETVTQTNAYPLRPLIFFEAHSEFDNKKFIIDNLQDLYDKGYRTVCVELEAGKSLDEMIAMHKKLLAIAAAHPEAVTQQALDTIKYTQLLLEALEKQPGMNFKGFDYSPKKLKDNRTDIEDENSELFKTRDKLFATSICVAARKNNGGIIAIVGLGHYRIQELIQQYDKNAEQYFSAHLYDNTKTKTSQSALLAKFTEPGAMEKHFPLGMLFCNVNKQNQLAEFTRIFEHETGTVVAPTAAVSATATNSSTKVIAQTGSPIHSENKFNAFKIELEQFMATIDRDYYASLQKQIDANNFNKALRMVCNDKSAAAPKMAAIFFKHKDTLKLDINEAPPGAKSALALAKDNKDHAAEFLQIFEPKTAGLHKTV